MSLTGATPYTLVNPVSLPRLNYLKGFSMYDSMPPRDIAAFNVIISAWQGGGRLPREDAIGPQRVGGGDGTTALRQGHSRKRREVLRIRAGTRVRGCVCATAFKLNYLSNESTAVFSFSVGRSNPRESNPSTTLLCYVDTSTLFC